MYKLKDFTVLQKYEAVKTFFKFFDKSLYKKKTGDDLQSIHNVNCG